jgi:uncharacterized protein
MKWDSNKQSENFEDRRGMSGGGKVIAGGGGIIAIVIVLLQIFGGETGQTVGNILQQTQGQNQQTEQTQSQSQPLTEQQKKEADFIESLTKYNEEVWSKIFEENNMQFEPAKMVLFTDEVQTACGGATAASGPFYCPGDQIIYMDMVFFEELKTRFGAKGGDFAIAYVMAHEYGHHIQKILGTSDKMRQAQQGKSAIDANKLSVALELQADFYAGVWAHNNQELLEEGDIEEALSAANAVGDDAIQSKMQGQVVPDSFTHGSSAKRMEWFKKGYKTGDINQGTTFQEM